jgi:4-aminobutyrate aminotransferase
LNQLVPGDFPKKTALFTDGAGAIENALKIARAYTKRSGIISFHGGFHGRTLFTSSIAGKVATYKSNLGSPVGEVYQIPFPSEIDNVMLENTKEALGQLFKHVVDPNRIAAIIIEPVQGEGGFRPATTSLMQYIRDICNEYNIVMIADEVQSGFGRTGKLFAMEHFNVCADITVMSKSIAAGIPMSAVTGRTDIMDSPDSGGLGGTYNGNPLGCVAANAVLDIIKEEELLNRSMQLGVILQDFLYKLKEKYSQIADIRGLGSMIAVEICTNSVPDVTLTRAIQKHARDNGLILITAGVNSNVIRFLYPLTIPEIVFNEALEIFSNAVTELCH